MFKNIKYSIIVLYIFSFNNLFAQEFMLNVKYQQNSCTKRIEYQDGESKLTWRLNSNNAILYYGTNNSQIENFEVTKVNFDPNTGYYDYTIYDSKRGKYGIILYFKSSEYISLQYLNQPCSQDYFFNNSSSYSNTITTSPMYNLLSAILTSTPEGDLRREEGSIRRKQVKYQKQIDRFEKKEAKRLVVGSDSYINCSKSRKVWLGSMLLSGAAGAFSYTQANNYALKYNNATTDASSIKKTGNIFYTAAPICFAAAGFSLIEYAIKTRKIKKAKPQSVYLYPQISPNNLGLNLTVKF